MLHQDVTYHFREECVKDLETLNMDLNYALIIFTSDWSEPFKDMCDGSYFAMGDEFHSTYYANKTLIEIYVNYTIIENDRLSFFSFVKFISYLVGTKVVVYIDNSLIKNLIAKNDENTIVIRWTILLQEFDLEI